MKSRSWILDILQASKYKLTAPRKIVIDWIAKHPGIFSVSELYKELSRLDKVSVYRTIELLTELDAIHPVLIQHGEQHYEAHGEKHHHHVVCTGCEKSECVACTERRAKIVGFTGLHHSVIFTGLCASCAKA